MKVERQSSKWGATVHFGVYADFQDWNILHHHFDIGFSFGPWDWGLKITLWDIEETIQMLKDHGMTDEEAWDFCHMVRETLPDPYDKRVSLQREIQKEWAVKEVTTGK